MSQHVHAGTIAVVSPEPLPPVTRWAAVWRGTAAVTFTLAVVFAFGVLMLAGFDNAAAGVLRTAAGVLFGTSLVAVLATQYVTARHHALVTAALDAAALDADDGPDDQADGLDDEGPGDQS